jgi:hypothetical protein
MKRGGWGGSAMKALVAVALPAVANAQPSNGCAQIVQNLNDSASAIAADANSYWAHRANFVDLIYGPSNAAAPNAPPAVPNPQAADQEKRQADTIKAGTPNKLASFKGLLAAAQAQGCLSPAQLSAIVEPTIKLAKRVNFDQFPPEADLEDMTGPGPPAMPKN